MKYLISSVVIFIFGILGVFNPIRDFFQRFFLPVEYGVSRSAVGIREMSTAMINIKSLHADNKLLLSRINELNARVVELETLLEQGKFVRESEISYTGNKGLLMTRFMPNANDPTGSTIIVFVGSSNNIRPGYIISFKNLLIGSVIEVSDNRSIVRLLTSPDFVLGVENRNSVKGVSHGQYGMSIKIDNVVQDSNVNIDDIFYSTGEEGKFRPGIGVGRVVEIVSDPASAVKSLLLEPLVDLRSTDFVFVELQ